ncbi:hypothetical protein GQ473_00240 [archaeon]|nr:hypothetical protein [archaeon]
MNKFSNVVSRYQKYFVFITIIFFAQLIFFSQNSFVSGVPAGPMVLSGNISINDVPAPKGTLIEAWIENEKKGHTITSLIGQYGDRVSNQLIVTCTGDNIITFRAKLPGEDTYAVSEATLECISWELKSNYDLDFIWDGVIEWNNPPVSNEVIITLEEDDDVGVVLDSNDDDGDTLTYEIIDSPLHGSLSGDMPNLLYIPDHNYFGEDSFSYRANDGIDDSNIAIVDITITPVNDISITYNLSVFTSENTLKTIILSAFDADGDDLSYHIVSDVINGDISILNNVVTYVPDMNYNGVDLFTFKVNDGAVDSNVATISITVSSVNTAPVVSDMPDVSFLAGGSITTLWTLDSYVFDVETSDDELIWSHTGGNPVSIIVNLNRTLSISALPDWSGNETIIFSAFDGNLSDSGNVIVSVSSVDDETIPVGPPILPALFFGTIMINGVPALVGTQITSYVGGDKRDTFTTTALGVYGQKPYNRFIINGDSSDIGKIVEFYVDGNRSDQTSIWGSGDIIEHNLEFIFDVFYEPIAPSILSIGPTGVILENRFNITTITDMNASCRFDYSSKDYEFMNYDFETMDGIYHNYEVYSSNGNYTVYARCMSGGLVSNPINITEFVVSASVADYAPMIVDANISVNNETALNGSVIYAYIDGVSRDSAEVIDGRVNLTVYGDAADIGSDVVFSLKIPGLENKSVSLQNLSWINGSYVYDNLTFEAHDVKLRDISNPSTIVSGSNVEILVVLENTQNTNETVNVSFYVDGVFLGVAEYTLESYESKTVSSDWIASGVGIHNLSFRVSFEFDQNQLNNFIKSQISVTAKDTSSSGGGSSTTFTFFGGTTDMNVSNSTVENITDTDDDGGIGEGDTDNEFKILDDVVDGFNPLNLLENKTGMENDTTTPTGFSFANPGTFAITAFVLTIIVLLGVRFLIMARI